MLFAGALLCLVAAFLYWRWTSVERGGRKRDERLWGELLDIETRLRNGQEVVRAQVHRKASQHELRPLLYSMLKHFEQLELFPPERIELEQQALADLAYWLCHPNELGDPPDEIEVVRQIDKDHSGEIFHFFALRFRKFAPHWAADDGWMLGVAGPYVEPVIPYFGAGAFSRFQKEDDSTPETEVDWCFEQFFS